MSLVDLSGSPLPSAFAVLSAVVLTVVGFGARDRLRWSFALVGTNLVAAILAKKLAYNTWCTASKTVRMRATTMRTCCSGSS